MGVCGCLFLLLRCSRAPCAIVWGVEGPAHATARLLTNLRLSVCPRPVFRCGASCFFSVLVLFVFAPCGYTYPYATDAPCGESGFTAISLCLRQHHFDDRAHGEGTIIHKGGGLTGRGELLMAALSIFRTAATFWRELSLELDLRKLSRVGKCVFPFFRTAEGSLRDGNIRRLRQRPHEAASPGCRGFAHFLCELLQLQETIRPRAHQQQQQQQQTARSSTRSHYFLMLRGGLV